MSIESGKTDFDSISTARYEILQMTAEDEFTSVRDMLMLASNSLSAGEISWFLCSAAHKLVLTDAVDRHVKKRKEDSKRSGEQLSKMYERIRRIAWSL